MNSILFDIGATKIRMAYTVDGETFEEPKVLQTPANYDEGFKIFADTARELSKSREIKAILGGASRSVWEDMPERLKNDLVREFGVNIIIENDAATVGLGEAVWGAGRGLEIVAYITVSTGVGGARIVNGKIDEHAIGFEPGQQIIDLDSKKTLEDLVSGKALARKIGRQPKEVTDPAIWDELAKILAIGLNNIAVVWSPDCIVLGGSMITGDPSIPIEKTAEYLKEVLKIFPKPPLIKKSELGDFGGLYGALAFLKQKNY